MKSVSVYILFILLLFSTNVFAQQTILVVEKDKNKRSKAKKEFYVLTADEKVRHGSYKVYNYYGSISTNGYYKNNMKDSLWTEFTYKGMIKNKGYYNNGIKTGIWEYYDTDSKLEQKYNHSKNELVYFDNPNPGKPVQIYVIQNKDTISVEADQPAMFIGGNSALIEHYQESIKYPEEAKENDVMGTVYIAVKIDSDGKASAHKAVTNLGFGLEEESLRAIKLLPNTWVPAKINGKVVDAFVKLPVKYVLVN